MTMAAAVIERLGGAPTAMTVPRPSAAAGETLVEVAAAAINPVDISIGAGTFYAAVPEPPYVPGVEGVGTVVSSDSLAAGTPVWLYGAGLGMTRQGALAELVAVADEAPIPLPDGSDLAVAAALGIPAVTGWLAVRERARLQAGDSVLVLGGSGGVGLAAVQAARAGGASRIVAAGRNAEALAAAEAAGADAVAVLEGDAYEIEAALGAACGDSLPNVIVDPLCGPPLEAAVAVAAPDARIVQLGQSAGPSATLTSGALRGKGIDLLGFSVFRVSREAAGKALAAMLELVAAGEWTVPHEQVDLEQLRAIWPQLDVRGSGRRVVALPAGTAG
ncbi:MAG: zinc-binding dehydrogenase [Actinobacteria bacterium]|nr:zinc-binding dehydrogenase [Actinomycetota bacterium]